MTQKKRHTRNPIKHHGHRPTEQFALIAYELIRDGRLTAEAFRVYALLVSHDPGYEESAEAIADRYGWGQARTEKAMKRLQDERLLVVQRYVTAKGTRAYETYHVHRSHRFTAAQVTEFGTTVVLGSPETSQGGDSERVGEVTQNGSGGLLETSKGGYSKRVTKEEQLEKQLVEQVEEQVEEGHVRIPWGGNSWDDPAVAERTSFIEPTKPDVDQRCSASPSPSLKKMPGGAEGVGSAGDVTFVSAQDLTQSDKAMLMEMEMAGIPWPARYLNIEIDKYGVAHDKQGVSRN